MMKLSGIQNLQSSVARQVYIGIQSIVVSREIKAFTIISLARTNLL